MLKKEVLLNHTLTFLSDVLQRIKQKWMQICLIWLTVFLSYIYFNGNIATAPKWILGLTCLVFTVIVLLKGQLHNIVASVIVLSGAVLVFCIPVMDAPDETTHYARALHISQGNIYLPENPTEAKVVKDFTFVEENFKKPLNKTHLFQMAMSDELVHNVKIYATNASSFIPYLPQVTGIVLARVFHLSVGLSILLGRFLNLLGYAFLMRLAIKKAGQLGMLFAVLALMPMSVYLAASFSTDAMANGLIFLVVALFYQFIQKNKVLAKDILLFFTLCAILITIKLPYVLLIGLLLFIPMKQFEKKHLYALVVFCIVLAAVLSVFWLKQSSHINSTLVISESNPIEKIQYTLMHFKRFVYLFSQELVNLVPSKFPSLFTFGWFTYGAGNITWFYLIFVGCMMFMFPYNIKMSRLTKSGTLLVALGITSAILMTAYLMWNSVQEMSFTGVQGRYLTGVFLLSGFFVNCSSLFFELDTKVTEYKIQKRNDYVLYIALLFILISVTLTILEYYGTTL